MKVPSSETVSQHLRTPLFRNAYALMLTTVATSGLGIVYWALAARYYSPEVVGLNSAAISTLTFLSGLAQVNLKGVFLRFIPSAGRRTRRLVWLGYLVSLVLAAIAGVLFITQLQVWSPALLFLAENGAYRTWFVVAVMLWGIFALQDVALTGLRETVWVPIENTAYGLVKIVLLVLLATRLPDLGIFASWTLPVILLIVPINYLIFRRVMPRHQQATAHRPVEVLRTQFVQYVGADYIGSLFSLAPVTLLPILVTNLLGPAANAHFYLAWIIANSLQLLNANLATSLTVEAVTDRSKLISYSYRALVHGLRLLAPLVVVLVVAAPFILQVFGKSYAEEGMTVMRLMGLAALPHMVNALYLGVVRVQQRIGQIIAVQALHCVLIFGLTWLLIGPYGIAGVGIAILASETLLAILIVVTQVRPWLLPARSGSNPSEP